jgi:hypothetical protein
MGARRWDRWLGCVAVGTLTATLLPFAVNPPVVRAEIACTMVWLGPTTGSAAWSLPSNWSGQDSDSPYPSTDDSVCFGTEFGGTAVGGVRIAMPDGLTSITSLTMGTAATVVFTSIPTLGGSFLGSLFVSGHADFGGVFIDGGSFEANSASIGAGRTGGRLGNGYSETLLSGNLTVEEGGHLRLTPDTQNFHVDNRGLVTGQLAVFSDSSSIRGSGSLQIEQWYLSNSNIDVDSRSGPSKVEYLSLRSDTYFAASDAALGDVDIGDIDIYSGIGIGGRLVLRGNGASFKNLRILESGGVVDVTEDARGLSLSTVGDTEVTGNGTLFTDQLDVRQSLRISAGARLDVKVESFFSRDVDVRVSGEEPSPSSFKLGGTTTWDIFPEFPGAPLIIGDNVIIEGNLRIQTPSEWGDGSARTLVESTVDAPVDVDAVLVGSPGFEDGEFAYLLRRSERMEYDGEDRAVDRLDIVARTRPGNPSDCDAPSGTIEATGGPATATEDADATSVVATFTNTTGCEQTATVGIVPTGGQPVEEGDVEVTPDTVTIPVGTSTTTLELSAPRDDVFEGDETGRLVFTGTSPEITGGVDVTVVDTTPQPGVIATPVSATVLEGEPFVFTVTTTAPSEIPIVVPVTLRPVGPDDADVSDFVAIPPTISIASAPFTIATFDDDLPEGDESAVLLIDGIEINLTILDDDQAAAGITLTGPAEPVEEGTTVRYTLNLPAPAPAGMRVTWRTSFDPALLSGPPASSLDVAPLDGLSRVIPANALSVTFDLDIINDDLAEPAESFLMIADIDGLLLDPSVETVIAPSDGTAGDDDAVAIVQLATGIATFPTLFEGWGDLFDFTRTVWGAGRDPVDLPVVTDELGSYAGVGDAARLAAGSIPRPELGDTLEQVVQRFDDPAEGACTVEAVARGVGGFPAASGGDVIRVRCARTLGGLAQAAGFTGDPWNDATPDVLSDLAADLGLDATGDLTVDTTFEVTFGVDGAGFFVAPAGTGIVADVVADLAVTGTAEAVGNNEVTIAGTAGADLTVTLRPRDAGDGKLRLDDLIAPAPELIDVHVIGAAAADLSLTDGENQFEWSGVWTVTTPTAGSPEVATGTQRLRLLLQLDGLSTGDLDAPDLVELNGVLTAGVWELDGGLTQAALGGFRITDASFEATVDANGIRRARADASLILDDRDPDVPMLVEVELVVDATGWRLTGQGLFGDVSLLGLVELESAVVDVLVVADADGVGGTASLTADRAVVFPDPDDDTRGLIVATHVEGSILADGSVSFRADEVVGNIAAGAVQFAVSGVDVGIGPSFASQPLLVIDEVTASFASLPDTTVAVAGLTVLQDGRVGATSASIDSAGGVFESAGLGGILPFDVTEVTLEFDRVIEGTDPPLRALDAFDVSVTGSIDQEALGGLPVELRIAIGGKFVSPTSPPAENVFRFSVSVDSLADGVIRPLDLGPIGIGIDGIEIGDITLGAEITIDGFVNGVLQPGVAGAVRIDGGFDEVDGADALEVAFDGTIREGLLDLDAEFTFSASRGGLRLDDLSIRFGLEFGLDAAGNPFLRFDLDNARLDSLRVRLGPFAVGTIGAVELDFDPEPGDAVLTIEGDPSDPTVGLTLQFLPGFDDLLAGWGGRAGGLAICPGGAVHLLDDAFFEVIIPPGADVGLPPEVPVRIDSAGLVFDVGVVDPDRPCAGGSIDGLTDVRVRLSGGVVANETFPLSFALDGVEVSLARLTGLTPGFPIVNLDGIKAGMTPQEIAPGVRLGGLVSFGTVPVGDGASARDAWYVQVAGLVGVSDIEFGGTAIVTEYGPVLISLTSPVGIPLGPSGLVLSSVSGGVRFNTEVPSIDDPTELLNLPLSPINKSLSRAEIIAAIEPAVLDGVDLWTRPFSVAASGHITSIASPGMAGGDVTVGMNIGFNPGDGVKLFVKGDLTAFGIDVGSGGALIDFTSPIEPLIDVAFALPGPSAGPLSLLMPAEGTFAMRIDTTGVAPAAAIALRTFVGRLAAGTLALGNEAFDAAARDLAAELDQQRHRPLAILLLDTDADGVLSPEESAVTITPELLANRLFALLPASPAEASTLLTQRPELLTTVIGELLAGLDGVVVDGDVDADLVAALGEGQRTLAAFIEMLSDSLRASGTAALAVFDPSLTIDAQLQPLILGIPFGEPEAGTSVRIDRSGVAVGFTVSINALLNRLANSIVPVAGGGIQSLMSLGATDSFEISAQLPLSGFVESLVTGTAAPRIDPDDGRWAITGRGRFGLFGYQSVGADLLITAPDNEGFVRDQVQLLFDEATGEPLDEAAIDIDPDRIPISTPEHFDNVVEFGGVLIGGRLQFPALLIDPVEVIDRIGPAPKELGDTLGWLRQVIDTSGSPATPLRYTAFFPSPQNLIVQQLDAIGDDRFSFDTGRDSFIADARNWLGAAFFDGVFDGTLLSLPVGRARAGASLDGIEISGQVPLVGVDGTFVLGTRDQDFGEGVVLPVPVADLRVTVDPLDRESVFGRLGLPNAVGVRAATMTVRAVSPGFDPASTDILERQGGVRLSARSDIDGLVDDARLDVGLFAPSNPLAGPDFEVDVGADQLGPFAGVTITEPSLSFAKRGTTFTGEISGRANVLGANGSVSGTLRDDLTGTFDVSFDSGQTPRLAEIRLSGAASIATVRAAGGLRASIGVTGTAQLPAWLASAGGTPTAQIGGCVDSAGNIEALLAVGALGFGPADTSGRRTAELGRRSGQSVGPAAAACTLPASTPPVPANAAVVRLRRSGGISSVFVDGQIKFNIAGATLPQIGATGSFDTSGRGSLAVNGSLPLLGTNLTIDGTVTIDPVTGPAATLDLTTPPGQPLTFGGFAVGGDLTLQLSSSAASVRLDDGVVTIPGVGPLGVDGVLSTTGQGSLAVQFPTAGLRLGGSSSPFVVTGRFALGFVGGVGRFEATNASLQWRHGTRIVASLGAQRFAIGSNGSLDVNLDGLDINDPSGFRLTTPDVDLSAGPGLSALRLELPAGTLRIPGVADGTAGRPAIVTPQIVIDTTASFRQVLTSGTLPLGLLEISGRLVFEGDSGVFRLAIEPVSTFQPARLTIAGLGSLTANGTQFIASNGTFRFRVSTNQLGPAALSIRGASALVEKTGAAFSSLSVVIDGGQLFLPLGAPIDLPDITLGGSSRLNQAFTIPALDLGSALRTSSTQLRLQQLSTGTMRLSLESPTSIKVLEGPTMTLNSFTVDTGGTFSGSITGRLQLFGRSLASATFGVSRVGSVVRVTLPSSSPALVSLGFASVSVSGTASSDGQFSFTGSLSVKLSIPIASLTGSIDVTVADTGISGAWNGQACVSVVEACASAKGTMDSTGFVDATVGFDLDRNGRNDTFFDVSFQFGAPGPTDTTRPSMTIPSNITVTPAVLVNDRARVNYTTPTSTDERDGNVPTICSPASGTDFAVGATTVTCRANDRAGNTRTRSFKVTVVAPSNPPPVPTMVAGATTTVSGSGFVGGTSVRVQVYSKPRLLATVTADANGDVSVPVTLPADLPPGEHTIVLEGFGADDFVRLVTIPILVVSAQAGGPDPSGSLPATGAPGTSSLLVWSLLVLLTGLAFLAGTTSDPVTRRMLRIRPLSNRIEAHFGETGDPSGTRRTPRSRAPRVPRRRPTAPTSRSPDQPGAGG